MVYKEEKIKVPRFNEASGFYTTKKRSKIMSKIRGKNTKPEMLFRKALWHKGVRYRVNSKKLPGKPDVSIQKYKLAIFIDGEFWHGYNWDEKKVCIKSNRDFWIQKSNAICNVIKKSTKNFPKWIIPFLGFGKKK